MNYISTWFCADEKGEESLFPQTGKLSSSKSHQNIYWRCIVLFYASSKRFNRTEKHLFFTNIKQLPILDGKDVKKILEQFDVKVIHTDFKYKTPGNYYGSFQNQFYEFSILEYIALNDQSMDNSYLILDSDCLFIKPAQNLFSAAIPEGFISFEDDVSPDYVINGLSRNDLKDIYEDLLQIKLSEIPAYHLGEFLLCSAENIRKIYRDFMLLWPQLLERNKQGLKKFNEEAHTLSFLYFKNGWRPSKDGTFMRRIWTNPVFYREVRSSDTELVIWHLPSEKIFGLQALYNLFFNRSRNYGFDISNEDFFEMVKKAVNVPDITAEMKMKYFIVSYFKALKKRIIKASV